MRDDADQNAPPVFHAAPPPTQDDVQAVVQQAAKRIVRFLQKRGLIALATALGDGQVTVVVGDETLGDDDPLLAQLLAAATAGAPPAGPAYKRAPIRLAMNGDAPKPKGRLCAEQWGFNLHAATRVHENNKQGREHLCRYILRPPFANHRLHTLPDGKVQLNFKRPWSDGTNAIVLAAHAFIARLAAIIPPPRRHVTRYFGLLSSHSALRARIIPTAANTTTESPLPADTQDEETTPVATPPVKRKSKYIPWNELLRRTFNTELKCANCKGDLRLIALIKTQTTIKKILAAMGLPTLPPAAATSARSPPCFNFDDWEN